MRCFSPSVRNVIDLTLCFFLFFLRFNRRISAGFVAKITVDFTAEIRQKQDGGRDYNIGTVNGLGLKKKKN